MSIATTTTLNPAQLDQLSVDTIRFLSVDAVQKANSGHPGLPAGRRADGLCAVDTISPA